MPHHRAFWYTWEWNFPGTWHACGIVLVRTRVPLMSRKQHLAAKIEDNWIRVTFEKVFPEAQKVHGFESVYFPFLVKKTETELSNSENLLSNSKLLQREWKPRKVQKTSKILIGCYSVFTVDEFYFQQPKIWCRKQSRILQTKYTPSTHTWLTNPNFWNDERIREQNAWCKFKATSFRKNEVLSKFEDYGSRDFSKFEYFWLYDENDLVSGWQALNFSFGATWKRIFCKWN